MVRELILKNRSYRRFYQNESISTETLRELIDLARLSPSAANLQPLAFVVSNGNEGNEKIFRNLSWAAYLKDWDGPSEGERPSAYIIILGDTSISKSFSVNHGIAAQSILIGAAELDLGGCIFGSINRNKLREDLSISDQFEILLVIALGKPRETVIIEEIEKNGDIKYWRDKDNRHHVPKRKLDDIIINLE
jgi:nitroreductase